MPPMKRPPKGMFGRGSFAELARDVSSTSSPSCSTGLPTTMVQPIGIRPLFRPPLHQHVLPLPPPPLAPQALGLRKDAPVILPTKRDSMELAMSSSLTPGGRTSAMADRERDMYPTSSEKPMLSHARAWERMHLAWFCPDIPQLPLTPEKLKAVAALFKAGRYRSIANPLSHAKVMHVEMGHPWTEPLSLMAKRIDRSITGGIGPASQCRSVDLWEVCVLNMADEFVGRAPWVPQT